MITRDIMTRKVYTISLEASVQEAAALLTRERISGVAVADKDDRIIGIVTQADIMSSEIIAVDEETRVSEIAMILSKRNIKRILVMCNDKVVGIVCRADIVRAVAQGYLVIRHW